MPRYFQMPFTLKAPGASSGEFYKTTGMYYYDSDVNQTRVDRADGSGDGVCNSTPKIGKKSTACTQLVDPKGMRWLVYPEVQYCCSCCSAADGCGFLRRDWLRATNASFHGERTVNPMGWFGLVWSTAPIEVQGDVFIGTPSDNTPIFIGDHSVNMTADSHDAPPNQTKPDAEVFKLPSYCTDKCGGSTCT